MAGFTHNYEKKLQEILARGEIPPGSLSRVDIFHDDWCRIYSGGFCNCDPEIHVQKLSPPPLRPSVN